MPPAKSTPPKLAVVPPVADAPPELEPIDRYRAALVAGKTEDEALLIGWPEGMPVERAPFEALHCPTPQTCFPYGFGPDTSAANCIHGETRA